MGALHEGHAQLARTAVAQNDVVVASIFVNPLQFGEAVDLERYPRTLDADLALLEAEGVDLAFAPSVEEVYPGGEPLVRITSGRLGDKWEGASRPGHFDGALTVVAKLLHYGLPGGRPRRRGRPYRAYFGQKDAQQLALVRRMVADLNFPVEIVPVPIVRSPDGLALSSRNRFLSTRNARPPWCCPGRCGWSRSVPTRTNRWTWTPPGRWWSPSPSWSWTTSTSWTRAPWSRSRKTAGRPRSAARAWCSSRPRSVRCG